MACNQFDKSFPFNTRNKNYKKCNIQTNATYKQSGFTHTYDRSHELQMSSHMASYGHSQTSLSIRAVECGTGSDGGAFARLFRCSFSVMCHH